ncbi:hypothetical protein BT93_K1283 [Corymbia citriodora subsp. variegata]|nr:hypothetical protein BT93_K1283 [Corymbia citriodora subsp. variegata]
MSIIPVLLRSHNGETFASALYSQANTDLYYFAILVIPTDLHSINNNSDSVAPVVVWSANPNHPVKAQATLELTVEGDLVLKHANSSVAWSTQTHGKSVAGMNLTDTGNLVLFGKNNAAVWQSFDHPTDTLLLGQKLRAGQKLTPSNSTTNISEPGLYSLSLTTEGLYAQIEADPPQVYFLESINFPNTSTDSNYIEFTRGHIKLCVNFMSYHFLKSPYSSAATMQYLKFESDGHLKVYQQYKNEFFMTHNTLTKSIRYCGYPMVCESYEICQEDHTCRCPDHYFNPIDYANHTLGCTESIPLSCEASQFQSFLNVSGVSYFAFRADPQKVPDLRNSDEESCKKACANDCSCRAAVFQDVGGSCYLVSQVFSLRNESDLVHRTAIFLKVQYSTKEAADPPNTVEPPISPKNSKRANAVPIIIITSSLGSLLAFIFLVVIKGVYRRKEVKDEKGVDEVEEAYLDQVSGAPKRFTYDDLKTITEDFNNKLGEGGFSSVYQGTQPDGKKVAVKQLDGLCQTKKSFLAEVESIGNIHHVNLVRLVGFCAEKFHKLLVYEYMSKGSLDKWIFPKLDESFMLDWQQRRKIIFDIAKGLCYLHEECIWKIVHMDIKPQNILLDEKFNAKIADFGLSKIIDRDQSQIVTIMRGTPSYLAPEWLHAAITERVDVYSFGVVILEIVCGRKVFDGAQNEEDMYLLGVFKRKGEEGQLLDMIDKNSENMQLNGPHVVDMMRLAAWCLQVDFTKRPSMLMVIKVLEGVMEVPGDLDYNFSYPTVTNVSVRIGQEAVELGVTISVVPCFIWSTVNHPVHVMYFFSSVKLVQRKLSFYMQ